MKKHSRAVLMTLLAMLLASVTVGCAKKEAVSISAQIEALKSADKDTRFNACVEISKVGPKAAAAVPVLITLLKDEDTEMRRAAAYAITEIGSKAKAAIPTLRELVNDRNAFVALQALNALRAIDPTAKNLQAPPNVPTGVKP